VPPFPFNDPETFESSSKDSVILFKTPAREGLHIEDVKNVNGEWVVTGTSGVVLIVCGLGSTMKQAPSTRAGARAALSSAITETPGASRDSPSRMIASEASSAFVTGL